ncbi:MAG: helix-turn-helix domain-containing protein [bacterium]|jgi:cytoskeletal protein RodZ
MKIPANLPDLSSIRQRKGISLRSISDDTKISIRYLEAIECGDFGKLPGGIFTTSYIRQYAHAIDYDEWHLLECYRSTLPRQEEPEPLVQPRRGLVPALLRILAGRA